MSEITVKGAREHNLKGINVTIPRNKITVITGLSGSGKSSLAFDTIYAEGQRRYIESMSAYARQFLEQLKKPEVEYIGGLSPAIAIDQKSVSMNPRSTVGTVTEIYDYLRLFFARVGTPHCPEHKLPMQGQTPQQIIAQLQNLPKGQRFFILSPMAQAKKGEFLNEFQKWIKKGFVRAKIDGEFLELATARKLVKTKAHDIDLVVDQLIMKEGIDKRLSESIYTALMLSSGRFVVELIGGKRIGFSIDSSCPVCSKSFPELEPRLFSFNHPRGACPDCNGLGTNDIEEVEDYSDEGNGRILKRIRYQSKDGKKVSEDDDDDDEVQDYKTCKTCMGSRLRNEALSVFVDGKSIFEVSNLSCKELVDWISTLDKKGLFSGTDKIVSEKIKKQILERASYLLRVGTGYLSLNRPSRTLSGGEAQRIRLATQVGSSLVGVLYVMDEPSIGLHPRDHRRLLEILQELKSKGNTILLVEHDEETIRSADHVIDIGPRAGKLGGEILAEGTPIEIEKNPKSITGRYLSGNIKIKMPEQRRTGNGKKIVIKGASGNNLKNVNAEFPLGTFTVVTGVSGSGKSTLILETLYKVLSQKINNSFSNPAPYTEIKGLEEIDKVIEINQRPIGRTSRSTPATYVGLFPLIRDLYSQLPESKIRGYTPGRFSFNVKGGRCENCLGHGQVRLEMHFLADVFVTCDICNGRRYSQETLALKYRGKSIADVLEMSVEEALEFFKVHSHIFRKLDLLHRVGLDYMTLGQSSTTLSGGEAQRVKL